MTPETEAAVRAAIGQVKTADDVRNLVNAIWLVAHDQDADRGEMLANLSLLSGVACAALCDYAVMLDDDRVEVLNADV